MTKDNSYMKAVKAVESAVDMLGFKPDVLAEELDRRLNTSFERYLMRMVAEKYLELTKDKEY